MKKNRDIYAVSLRWILVLLGCLFVLAAAVRRLNFDESLALRSGWLLVNSVPSSPPIYTPTTLLLGILGDQVASPRAVNLTARLLVSLSVLAAMLWGFRRWRMSKETWKLAAIITLSQGAFLAHALEFRYDWAILVAWLFSFGLLGDRGRWSRLLLGLCVSWLLAHHVKGLYFGGCLYLMAVVSTLRQPERLRRLSLFHASMISGLLCWLAITAALDRFDALTQMYQVFWGLAGDPAQKIWPWQSKELVRSLSDNAVWWVSGLVALGWLVVQLARRRDVPDRTAVAWALCYFLVTTAFLLLHPHPWPYMLALPAPFLGLVVAALAGGVVRHRWPRAFIGLPFLAVALQLLLTGGTLWEQLSRSLRSDRSRQEETLRVLKRHLRPGDRVIDPSGLAYFTFPCTEEWYIDTLFEARMRQGAWMNGMNDLSPERCPWLVISNRLQMMTEPVNSKLSRSYTFVGAALAVHNEDRRRDLLLAEGLPGYRAVLSYW